jgi:hypothetical protein
MVADALNLEQSLRLGILRLRELEDLPIVLLDLERHLRDLLEHRSERACKPWRHRGEAALGETPR